MPSTAAKAIHLSPKLLVSPIHRSAQSAFFLIDGIVSFNENELKGIRSTGNAGRSIRALELDKFYLLSDSYRAAYLAKKSETVHRIGYRGQGRSGLLTQIVSRPKKKMQIHRRHLLMHMQLLQKTMMTKRVKETSTMKALIF